MYRSVAKAIETYKNEITRWSGGTTVDETLIKACKDVADASQVTVLESQLCRVLHKKDLSEMKAGVQKYLSLYASVKSDLVVPQVWLAAQAILKGST